MNDLDWSDSGVDWRDSTKDDAMAADWLRNRRLWAQYGSRRGVPDGYDLDLDSRVLELVQTDLDVERGWLLVLHLLAIASDELDFGNAARLGLEVFVTNHGDEYYDQIDHLAATDPRFRRALGMMMEGWPGPLSRSRPR